MKPEPFVTPLEVLRNFFGSLPSGRVVESLSRKEIEDLGDRLSESAQVSSFEHAPSETYYPGGWLGSGWHYPIFRNDLQHALLYYQRLLVHDPLADFFFSGHQDLPKLRSYRSLSPQLGGIYGGPDLWASHSGYAQLKDYPEQAARYLSQIVANLTRFEPLIDAGILILRSQWPIIFDRQHQIMTSVRHNVRSETMVASARAGAAFDPPVSLWDNLRGLKATPVKGVHPADRRLVYQGEFFYLAKTLAIADQMSARYVAPTDADFALLKTYATTSMPQLRGLEKHPERVLSEVMRLAVPSMELDPATTVSLRQNEESFASWRHSLRKLARDGQDDDEDTLAQRVEDELVPRIQDIRNTLSRSQRLKNLVPDGIEVALTVGLGILGGTAAGPGGAIAGTLPGAAAWAYNALKEPALSSNDTVLARLIQK